MKGFKSYLGVVNRCRRQTSVEDVLLAGPLPLLVHLFAGDMHHGVSIMLTLCTLATTSTGGHSHMNSLGLFI